MSRSREHTPAEANNRLVVEQAPSSIAPDSFASTTPSMTYRAASEVGQSRLNLPNVASVAAPIASSTAYDRADRVMTEATAQDRNMPSGESHAAYRLSPNLQASDQLKSIKVPKFPELALAAYYESLLESEATSTNVPHKSITVPKYTEVALAAYQQFKLESEESSTNWPRYYPHLAPQGFPTASESLYERYQKCQEERRATLGGENKLKAAEEYTKPFCQFMTENPTVWHAVSAFEDKLTKSGFKKVLQYLTTF